MLQQGKRLFGTEAVSRKYFSEFHTKIYFNQSMYTMQKVEVLVRGTVSFLGSRHGFHKPMRST